MRMELENRIFDKINDEKKDDILSFPKKNLLIEITNYCNNKCIFCYNDCMKREKKFIDKNFCEKVLKDAFDLGMREVGFYVVGEPLIDKRLPYFISIAKEIGYEYIYLTTNGILANLEAVKELYNSGLNSIKYSINAVNEKDYIMIHGTNNFNKVIKNLSEVYEWKCNENKNLKIYVSYISIDITKKEKEISELFSNICDEYVMMPAINQGGLMPYIYEISSRNHNDINGNFKLPCSYPFNSVIVTVDGYLTACCMDFENFLSYADLNKVSLVEAWNNNIIKNFRKKHLEKNVSGTICDNCINNVKNIPLPLDNNLCNLDDNFSFKILKKINKGVENSGSN